MNSSHTTHKNTHIRLDPSAFIIAFHIQPYLIITVMLVFDKQNQDEIKRISSPQCCQRSRNRVISREVCDELET